MVLLERQPRLTLSTVSNLLARLPGPVFRALLASEVGVLLDGSPNLERIQLDPLFEQDDRLLTDLLRARVDPATGSSPTRARPTGSIPPTWTSPAHPETPLRQRQQAKEAHAMHNVRQHLARRSTVRRATLLAAAGAALAATLLASAGHAGATAPGQNGRIVFRRYLDVAKTTSAIFTVRPDGTHERQVTYPPPGSDDRRPDYAPNGHSIAFERKTPCPAGGPKDGLNNTCDLVYTVQANGTRLRSLVSCGFDANAPFPGNCVGEDDPAWSPDGSQIAFQYNLADPAYTGSLGLDAGIWIVNRDGTGLHQVTERTPATDWDFGAQWSPDGRQLAFVRSDLSSGADAIFTVDTDGSNEHQVTPWTLNGGDRTDWSPDGRWILFRVQGGDGSSNLYEAHPDGSAITNLTNQGANGFQYLSPSFSPDGTQIVSARTPGAGPEGAADIVIMNADGSDAHAITGTRLWESATDWGPKPHG
jgi:hypothetical protein